MTLVLACKTGKSELVLASDSSSYTVQNSVLQKNSIPHKKVHFISDTDKSDVVICGAGEVTIVKYYIDRYKQLFNQILEYQVSNAIDGKITFAPSGNNPIQGLIYLPQEMLTQSDWATTYFDSKNPDKRIVLANSRKVNQANVAIFKTVFKNIEDIVQNPEHILGELMHHDLYHTYSKKSGTDFLSGADPNHDDLSLLSQILFFTQRKTGPAVSRINTFRLDKGIHYCGFDTEFRFPFRTIGTNDIANEILLEYFLRGGSTYDYDAALDLFIYIMQQTSDQTSVVASPYDTYILSRDSKRETTYKNARDIQSRAENGKRKFNQTHSNRLNASNDSVDSSVFALDEIDVLRRTSLRVVERARNTSSKSSLHGDAAKLYDEYLRELSQHRGTYMTHFRPVVIEPELMQDTDFIEKNVRQMEPNRHKPYYRDNYGRSILTLSDLKDGSISLSSAGSALEGAAKESRDIVSISWLGKYYVLANRNSDAESRFNEVLKKAEGTRLSFPESIAVIRSLKGMVKLGKPDYQKRLINYSYEIISKCVLTAEQIRAI